MNEKLVSVVVPIYNVEKYLDCCVESIVNQTYKNLEIILVDDGSPDSCPEKCDDWAKRDARIRVIHKKNQGLGMARNTGIENAIGEYICFFDSDDYIDLCLIEKAYRKAEQYQADIVLYGLKDFDDAGNILLVCIPDTQKEYFSGNEIHNVLLPDLIDASFKESKNKSLPFSAWSGLFSMHLVGKAGWNFVSEREIISEDSYSLLQLYKHVDRVCILNEALYFHRRNVASLSRSFRKERFEKTKDFAQKALKLAKENGYSLEVDRRICGLFFNFIIDAIKHIVESDLRFSEKIRTIRSICKDAFFRQCLLKCCYGQNHMAKMLLKYTILLKMPMITYLLVYIRSMKK